MNSCHAKAELSRQVIKKSRNTRFQLIVLWLDKCDPANAFDFWGECPRKQNTYAMYYYNNKALTKYAGYL